MNQSIQNLIPTSSFASESMFIIKQESSLQSQNHLQYFQNLERSAESPHSLLKLNNHDLEFGLKKLIHHERKLLHLILLHIKEVENRKLYLKKAYPSLFEYLVKEHGYSAGSAMRRIEAARLLKDVPQMAQKIQSGEINLSQITEISRVVKEKQRETRRFVSIEEKEDLVLKVAGLSLAETQKVVSLELNVKAKQFEKKRTQRDESVRLEITLTKAQMEKLNQCKDLAAHILEQNRMDSSMASVFEVLMDQFFIKRKLSQKHDALVHDDTPAVAAIESTTEKSITSCDSISNLEVNSAGDGLRSSELISKKGPFINQNNPITPKIKSRIRQRDQCCQFIDPTTNKKCNSTYKLEIDHQKPKWAGGSHQENNLQVLCKNHNNFKYQREASTKLRS